MDVLDFDDSPFRDPDGNSLPVAVMSLVCDATGVAVGHLLTLSPHQQLQQRLLSLLEAIQPSDRIDASALLPAIDAYETLVQHELDTGLRVLPHTLDGLSIPDSTFYESHLSNERNIHLLGETHGFPTSIGHLRTIIKSLDGVPAKDILFLLENASSVSFLDVLRHSIHSSQLLADVSCLLLAANLAQSSQISSSFSVMNAQHFSVLSAFHRLIISEFPCITFIDVVAFFVWELIVRSAVNQNIDLQNVPREFISGFLSDFSSYHSLHFRDLEHAFFALNSEKFSFLQKMSDRHYISICAVQTAEEVQQAIQKNTHVKHVVCIAGADHIPSIREGLGVSSAAV